MGIRPDSTSNESIFEYLKKLEERISAIEKHLHLDSGVGREKEVPVEALPASSTELTEDALEIQLGQNWFAKAGIVGLALGVIFLLTFPYQDLPAALPSAFGYVLVGGIFALSYYWRDSYVQISRYLLGGALLLFYFTTLRLAFFSPTPPITSTTLLVALLCAVVVINLVVSSRAQSVWMVGQHIALGYLTALFSGEPWFVFTVVTVMSGVAVYLASRHRWSSLLIFGPVMALSTHFLWAVNNPILGNEVQFVTSPSINLLFVLFYGVIFAVGSLREARVEPEDLKAMGITTVNGLCSYGLFFVLTMAAFREELALWQFVASLVFLSLSIVFWVRVRSKYATFVYSMLGYVALSMAIVSQFETPDFFVWLCWQSILVISTAVWYHSRFIIVANFFIYIVVFLAYLFAGATMGLASVSFGIVALLSARILNWQKDRLELKTDVMRTAYLACALLFLPYALYHVVPSGYVSLSWLGLASFYYIASRILKNRKYRWMALLTMSLTILYVFLVDLVGVDPALRIVSFLVLGSVLLAISMIYSRKRSRTEVKVS